jgi:hypothetical protein
MRCHLYPQPRVKIPVTFFEDDPPLVWLRCYEPAGLTLELDRDTLLRHLLLVGGTGAGKTSILNVVLSQLLAAQAHGRPIGILLLDGKQDDSVARVTQLAAQAGRAVQVLTPGGALRYDLLGSLRTLDHVDTAVQRLLQGARPLGGDNHYWDEMRHTMIDAALSLLVAQGAPVAFDHAVEFMRQWFYGVRTDAKVLADVIQRATQVLAEGRATLPAPIQRKLGQALDTVELWRLLDPRTKSNVQSTLLSALRPLLGSQAGQLFDCLDHECFRADAVVQDGAVMIVSSNAITEPGLTRLLFRLVKQDFYGAVQRRNGGNEPLTGLILDEYPLAASVEDLENLQTLRSKNGFVIATTQGFIGLDREVGVRTRQALVAGFQNLIAMRSHEIEVDALMFNVMGEREEADPPRGKDWFGALVEWPPHPPHRPRLPVCPLGALARLRPFEAFVSLANGTHPPHRVWIEPLFVPIDQPSAPAGSAQQTDPLADVIARIRGREALPPATESIFDLMNRAGGRILMPLPVWQAAADLCEPAQPRQLLVEQVSTFFQQRSGACPQGLENLPACWLRALPGLLDNRARTLFEGRFPFVLTTLAEQSGALALKFSREEGFPRREREIQVWDVLRVSLNCHLYPSLWRPLTRHHWRLLNATRPELRPSLRLHAKAIGGSWQA